MIEEARKETAQPTLTKLALDLGPLLVFFGINAFYGIFAATAVFMAAIAIALATSRYVFGEVALMPIITAFFVLIFGGLTLYLQDETFIKMKPTVAYLLFAGILLVGIAAKRIFLKMMMSEMLSLSEKGWLKLTYRWAIFFIAMACLNEVVWRNLSTDNWVNFKVFGLLPLTLVFGAAQVALLQKYAEK